MSISREEVRRIADLARLRFEGDEEEKFAGEMGRIVDYVKRLEEVDTSNVEPLAHVLGMENVLAPDQPQPSIDRGIILKNAPDTQPPFLRFPRVIEESGEAS